jgi:hypothetical protein
MVNFQTPDNFFPTTTSIGTIDPDNPWAGLAGPVSARNRKMMNANTYVDTDVLPAAYEGRNEYLGLTLEDFLLSTNDMLNSVLPIKYTDKISFVWNIWRYGNDRFDQVPELAPSRYIAHTREGRQVNSVRYGQAIKIEYGYLTSEEGQRSISLSLVQQVRNMMLTINDARCFELYNAKNIYREQNMRSAVHTLDDAMSRELDQYARVQKSSDGKGMYAIDLDWTDMMTRNGVSPTMYIMPPRMMQMNQVANTNLQTDGDIAIRNLNQTAPSQGFQGRFPPQSPNGKLVYGLIAHVYNFTKMPSDLSRRVVQHGEYFCLYQFDDCLRNNGRAYDSCLRQTKVLDMSCDNGIFKVITVEDMLRECQRFNSTDGSLTSAHDELIEQEGNYKFNNMAMLDNNFIDVMFYYEPSSSSSSNYKRVTKFGQMELNALDEDAVNDHAVTAAAQVLGDLTDDERERYTSGLELMMQLFDYSLDQDTVDFFIANAEANLTTQAADLHANQTRKNRFGCENLAIGLPAAFNGYPRGCGTWPWFFYLADALRRTPTFRNINEEVSSKIRAWEPVAKKIIRRLQRIYDGKYCDALNSLYCPSWMRSGDVVTDTINTLAASVLDGTKLPIWVNVGATIGTGLAGALAPAPVSAASKAYVAAWDTVGAGLGANAGDASLIDTYASLVKLLQNAAGTSGADKAAAVIAEFESRIVGAQMFGNSVNNLATFNAFVLQALNMPVANVSGAERVYIWNQIARLLDGTDSIASTKKISAAMVRDWAKSGRAAAPPAGGTIRAQHGAPEVDSTTLTSIGSAALNPRAVAPRLIQTSFVVSPHAFWELSGVTGVYPSNPINPSEPLYDASATPGRQAQLFRAARERGEFDGQRSMKCSLFKQASTASHYSDVAAERDYFRMDVALDDYGVARGSGVPVNAHFINKNFEVRWSAIHERDGSGSDMERACKLLLLLSDVNLFQLLTWDRNNVIVPFDFMGVRPFIRYSMHTALLLEPGRALGETVLGHIDCQFANNVQIKQVVVHTTMYLAVIVKDPSRVAIIENIFCSGYNGGEGLKFYTPDMFNNTAYDTANGRADVIAMLLPYGTTNRNKRHPLAIASIVNITGVHDRRVYERQMPPNTVTPQEWMRPTYPSAVFYCFLYDWRRMDNAAVLDPCTEMYSSETVRRNTVCFQGPQQVRCPLSRTWSRVIQGRGHWGANAFDGVKPYRTGKEACFPPYNVSSDRIL